MVDLNAFERQLADESLRIVGPVRPVDDLAVFEAATSRSQRWGFTMLSALKFIAAGVIVALFGGFLLAGVLTTPQGDEVAPAAVTDSPERAVTSEPTEVPDPSVRTDILPGVALTVEEVEPSVFRVVDDGVRDLTSVDAEDIAAGYDGGIRLLREDDFIRLGSDETHQLPVVPRGDIALALEVAPDGTMWVIPCRSGLYYPKQCGDAHRSTDGEEWTPQPCPRDSLDCQGFTVASDGTVWATWRVDGTTRQGRWRVGQLGPTGWQPLDGDARYDSVPFRGYRRMIVTDAGGVYGMGYDNIYRYEDGGWDNFAPRPWDTLHDVGPDGTVWYGGDDGLVRFADGEWEHWALADLPDIRYGFGNDDVVDTGAVQLDESRFEVAPGGSLWFDLWRDSADPRIRDEDPDDFYSRAVEVRLVCDGLTRFDGQTLDRFLPGRCISMDVAADGSVWVLAADDLPWVFDHEVEGWGLADDHTWDLYVITPEAVTATEVTDIEVATTTTSDVLPGVTLTVEEVEPGVFRVVSDGVRDLEQVNMTVVGDDGSVWMDSARGIFELGRAGEHPGLVGGEGLLAFAEDGTLWAASADGPEDLRSFDGETWTPQGTIPDGIASAPDPWWPADYITDFAVHPDGTVWQVAEQNGHNAYTRVQHLGTETWTTYAIGDGLPDLGWCGVCVEGEPCPAADCEGGWGTLEITPDGTVWVGVPPRDPPIPTPSGGLLRFDGTDWEVVRPLGGDEDYGVVGLLADRDGVLWAEFETGDLARFDGQAWEVFSYTPAGDPDLGGIHAVDLDGDLWVGSYSDGDHDIAGDRCDGVRRFDGSTWTTFLSGVCVTDIDIASDGSVWTTVPRGAGLAWVPGYGHGGVLYVITPEAVAATE